MNVQFIIVSRQWCYLRESKSLKVLSFVHLKCVGIAQFRHYLNVVPSLNDRCLFLYFKSQRGKWQNNIGKYYLLVLQWPFCNFIDKLWTTSNKNNDFQMLWNFRGVRTVMWGASCCVQYTLQNEIQKETFFINSSVFSKLYCSWNVSEIKCHRSKLIIFFWWECFNDFYKNNMR